MEFFNKKEDVIGLHLTQYGRHLLSKGKFKPQYYSFFDDNILYNSNNAGFSEEQNDAEARIQDTQRLKPQISISSAERAFNSNYELIVGNDSSPVSAEFQRTAEKNYLLPQPLGTSDINSEYAPSWSVRFLNGGLTGSVEYLNLYGPDGGINTQLIPQIQSNLKVEYEFVESAATLPSDETESELALSDVSLISEEKDLFILLKIGENNGFFQKKNFDIELFEITEEKGGANNVETLRPLRFSDKADPETEVDFLDETYPDEDVGFIEYYFDILLDDEVSDELICNLDPRDKTLGVFADQKTIYCQDIINQQKRKVFDIYEDESDLPGEVC
jgi:hypothetical protein